jgi:hypothetical protein
MAAWTPAELATIGDAEEIDISSRRGDGSLRPYVTIWVVRVGDDLYVRSVKGRANSWFGRAGATGEGRIRSPGAGFEEPGPEGADAITAAYHAKYDHYGPRIVGSVVSSASVAATFRLVPRS